MGVRFEKRASLGLRLYLAALPDRASHSRQEACLASRGISTDRQAKKKGAANGSLFARVTMDQN